MANTLIRCIQQTQQPIILECTQQTITFDTRPTGRRALRTRTVDLAEVLRQARAVAASSGAPEILVVHGGVATSGRGRSEAAVVVAMPNGQAVAWVGVDEYEGGLTLPRVLARLVGDQYRSIEDRRCGVYAAEEARVALIQYAVAMLNDGL